MQTGAGPPRPGRVESRIVRLPTGHRDPRVDAYIESAAEFARPILRRLRELVHEACPEIEEAIKWHTVSFELNGLLCGMAAFKKHCVFGFWKHKLVFGEAPRSTCRRGATVEADGPFGRYGKITSLADLPPRRRMLSLIRKAVAINKAGLKVPHEAKPKKRLTVPKDLAAALRKNRAAAETFAGFSYSKRRDYIE